MWQTIRRAGAGLLCAGVIALASHGRAFAQAGAPATMPGAAATTQPIAVGSRVITVTVYQGSALVTRELDLPAGTGQMEVSVSPLPPTVIDSSLYSEAPDGIHVLSTQYRMRPVETDTRAEVRAKEQEIQNLQDNQQRLQESGLVMHADEAFVAKLENFTSASMTTLLDKGVLNATTPIDLAKYVMQQREALANHAMDALQREAKNTEALTFAQRQLGELTASSTRTEVSAVIVLEKTNPGPAKVRLNYLVNHATWAPQYRFRAAADNVEKAPIQLEYLAAVQQQTGEDWDDVQVILSTAEPMLNAAPPELMAMDVTVGVMYAGNNAANQSMAQAAMPTTSPSLGRGNYDMQKELRMEAQSYANAGPMNAKGRQAADEINGRELFNKAAALQQTQELLSHEENRGQGESETSDVSYHLATRHTIASREDSQLIAIARIDNSLSPAYFYKAVPVLTPHVFRLATLVNHTSYVLLPGEATMYMSGDFVGRMNLPLVAMGQSFTIGLGVDPQIQVTRELVSKTNSVQGANQVHEFEYRIRVSSFKTTPIDVQLWDRLPRPEGESVGVSLIDTTPALSDNADYQRAERPQNLLRWDLKIPAAANGEKAVSVDYKFKLEYDRNVAIGNFKASK